MTARAYSVYVGHMCEAIESALEFTAGLDYAAFLADKRSAFATVRALEILGEAAKRVPDDVRGMEPTIPWRQMAGMRDVIIHNYDDVDLGEVWNVVRNQIGELLPPLRALQATLEQREDEEWGRLQGGRPGSAPDGEGEDHG